MSAYLEPLEDSPRCRRWNLIVSVGSGKNRRRKSRSFVGGKREAQVALREFENSTVITKDGKNFCEFATAWNDARLDSGAIATATHEKYYWFIRTLTPYLDMPLESIRPSHIQAAYAALSVSRCNTTLLSLHNSLQRIFRAAEYEGMVTQNPMADIDAPKPDTKEKRALSPSKANELLDALDPADTHQFAVSLILRCGLRRKEVVGIEWQDVDAALHIRREVTKSDAGVRSIPLDESGVELIARRRSIVEDALGRVEAKLLPTDKLCCGLDGRPLSANALRLWWSRNRASFGLEGWTLHELRHTFLTNLAQAGVHPSVMQRLAGHSSMSTTLRIYTHVHDEDMVSAIQSLQSVRQSARNSARTSDG